MRPQIIHDAEVHRQHVRLKIPIQVEIDGIRHQVDDWSVGGFAVESVLTSRKPDECFWVRLIFPFEEFELTMRREARMVYVDQGHGRFGCDFLAVSERHAEVLHYLVDASLAGELVSPADLLQARARGNAAPAAIPAVYDGWRRRGAVARYRALSRLRVVRARRAGLARRDRFRGLGALFRDRRVDRDIDAPVVEFRAPIAGRFVSALEPGERVLEGAALGRVHSLDGATLTLESPCDCRVLDQLGLSGLYHQAGDPLIALVPAQEPLMVRAQLALQQAERLGVGDRAEIRVPGRGEPVLGQIAQIDFTPVLQAMRSRAEPSSPHLADVLVRPDLPFDFQDFGGLVSIRFR
jgi:mannuronan synthase